MQSHRRRPHGKRRPRQADSTPSPGMSPISGPLPSVKLPNSLSGAGAVEDANFLMSKDKPPSSPGGVTLRKTNSRRLQRAITNNSQTQGQSETKVHGGGDDPNTCWNYTGMNFIAPLVTVYSLIFIFVWWAELKDNALDYYYLQYPEQQPVSPIPGTVLPLIPNVWIYDPENKQEQEESQSLEEEAKSGGGKLQNRASLKKEVQQHLHEHRQPHYYMLPQDFYDQQPPSDQYFNSSSDAYGSNTALEAPKIRGVLIVLHNCHQSGLHFFQLPESRIVAAHALQRGLAIFSPTASSASRLLTNANANKQELNKRNNMMVAGMGTTNADQEKNCWSASLDGDELLGPLLYEWVREMNVVSLPRMAIGVSNGANLLVDSSLYRTLRLQSMALYGSHHAAGFDKADLELDVVPATTFVTFPKNVKATEFAINQYNMLLQQDEEANDQEESQLRKEEEQEELEKEEEDDVLEDEEGKTPTSHFFRKTQLYKVESHLWTPSLCQARLPEYHTRCRSFFRHLAKFQKSKQRKVEIKESKQSPQQRLKRLRLGVKQKHQLITSKGEVLQSSKSPYWIPVMESLGLDDWTTHMMAFSTTSTTGATTTRRGGKKIKKRASSQLMKFPTTATAEGRSWLWASMLQEIEVAFGLQEMTSEFSSEILDFLMHHAGIAFRGGSGSIAKNGKQMNSN